MTLAAASPLTRRASLSNAKPNILLRTGRFPGHPDTKAMMSLRSDPVLCGSWVDILDGDRGAVIDAMHHLTEN